MNLIQIDQTGSKLFTRNQVGSNWIKFIKIDQVPWPLSQSKRIKNCGLGQLTEDFFTDNLLTIASFRIGVPSILFLQSKRMWSLGQLTD